jgi:dimethyladenosine transferase
MKLTDIKNIKEIMRRHDTVFKKKFGQNFLVNEAIPRRIAESLTYRDNVIEIGPGIGTLTYELCGICDKVTAVEIDSDLIPVLDETLEEFDNVEVINADILKTDIATIANGEYSVAANLPYYITTPVVMYLLECKLKPREIVIMVQKEVADRLCSKAGSKEYGAITASVAWYGKAEKLFNVSAGSFMPPPKIDSTVMKITLYQSPLYDVKDEAILHRVIRGAFAQRRKTLVNSLSSEFAHIGKQKLAEIITECGYDDNVRGEKLDIADFVNIANKIN